MGDSVVAAFCNCRMATLAAAVSTSGTVTCRRQRGQATADPILREPTDSS